MAASPAYTASPWNCLQMTAAESKEPCSGDGPTGHTYGTSCCTTASGGATAHVPTQRMCSAASCSRNALVSEGPPMTAKGLGFMLAMAIASAFALTSSSALPVPTNFTRLILRPYSS